MPMDDQGNYVERKVRAKFFVQETTHTISGGSVKLGAVCRGKDNKSWSKSTPSGLITMSILNDAALTFFVPGEEVYVDFSSAPKGIEG